MDAGSEIKLTAIANNDSGNVFSGWLGDLNSTDSAQTVVMDGPVDLTAVFEINTTGIRLSGIPSNLALLQNHPNPCQDLES